MNVSEWIKANGVTMTTRRLKGRTDGLMEDSASHWRCTLKNPGTEPLVLEYSMGSAYTTAPEIAQVLGCVIDDVQGLENTWTFDGWCGEYGYDLDSRKAEKIYQAVEKERQDLAMFAGTDVLNLDRDD